MRSFNYALLFVLIQQITVTFISYSIRNYNAMTLEIWTKDNLWRKILGKILKGFYVMSICPGWNIFWNLINKWCGIRMSWVGNFLKIDMRGKSVRDLRVRNFTLVKRCAYVITCLIWQSLNCLYIFCFSFFSICLSHLCAVYAALGSSLT